MSGASWRSRRRPGVSGVAWVALAIDLAAGEPPAAFHPTVGMGRVIAGVRRRAGAGHHTSLDLLTGLTLAVGGAALSAVIASSAARLGTLGTRGSVARCMMHGALLKPALSLRALLSAGRDVEGALRAGNLPLARRLLGWHLVSRDVRTLSRHEIAGAAIESLAENLSDGLVAPLMAYALAGLPAAYAYRFVNTADAMLGYHTPELEWLGKSAARLDDLLNLLPSRVTAGLLVAAAPWVGGSASQAAHTALRDARRTPSPNAGWPMAAAAGALGVRLDKRDTYCLNATGRQPDVDDLARCRRLVAAAALGAVAFTELAVAVRGRA